jgi:uncharacterized membrane protein
MYMPQEGSGSGLQFFFMVEIIIANIWGCLPANNPTIKKGLFSIAAFVKIYFK